MAAPGNYRVTVDTTESYTSDISKILGANWQKSSSIRRYNWSHVHELDKDSHSPQVTDAIVIPPSASPSVVMLQSAVHSDNARALNSREYLKVVRKRQARILSQKLSSLKNGSDSDTFEAYIYPVFSFTKKLIHELSTADSEGPSCEILRKIRDSMIDGKHELYRSGAVIAGVLSVLSTLHDKDEVENSDAEIAEGMLKKLGLSVLPDLSGIFVYEPDVQGEE